MLSKIWGIMFKPTATWRAIGEMSESQLNWYLFYPVILGLLPTLAWYYGTTQVGWTVAGDSLTRLTPESAAGMAASYFFAQLAAIAIIGYLIHWMSKTYDADTSTVKGIVIAGFTATPILLAGVAGVYPLLTLNLLLAIVSSSWAVYLLYKGVPLAMKMPSERGFLYASAIVGVVLVMFISLMGATLILWDMGFEPVFQD
jgi:small-conductance mechanosensitive channel